MDNFIKELKNLGIVDRLQNAVSNVNYDSNGLSKDDLQELIDSWVADKLIDEMNKDEDLIHCFLADALATAVAKLDITPESKEVIKIKIIIESEDN